MKARNIRRTETRKARLRRIKLRRAVRYFGNLIYYAGFLPPHLLSKFGYV